MTRSTEEIARETVAGLFTELAELCDAMNDDRLASWELARQKASEVVMATDTVCRAIAARQDRTFLDRLPQINTPEEDAAMDEAEAKAVDHAHVNPVFAPILGSFFGRGA